MALFTDGPISSIEDLRGHDTQLTEVANVEGIDVTVKLAMAQEEIAVELKTLLERMGPRGVNVGSLADLLMERVVITGPLRLWHTYRSLEMVYRDAYYNQLNDRYAAKRDEYRGMARWAFEKVMQSGLGMTADPLPQAAMPVVRTVPGGLVNGTYYVGISWCNSRGEEGGCSVPATVTTAGCSFDVEAWGAPPNATGWNVYVGSGPQGLRRQNSEVVAMGSVWTQGDFLAAGKMAGSGQGVGYVAPLCRLIERG